MAGLRLDTSLPIAAAIVGVRLIARICSGGSDAERDGDGAVTAGRTSSRFSATTIKEWFWTAFGLNFLLVLAQDIGSVDGRAWTVVRVTVLAVLAILLFGWAYIWVREATGSEGGWRQMATGWTSPALMAGAIVGVSLLVALLIDDLAS